MCPGHYKSSIYQSAKNLYRGRRAVFLQTFTTKHSNRKWSIVLCGKSSCMSTQNFSAANKIINKAVYCVDNVSTSVDIDDLCQFVRSMNVNVLSCFPAKPRRRQNESNLIIDRKAFRLCIDAADKDKLLDESKWPHSVIISEWYYLNPASRMNSTTAAMTAVSNAETSGNNADPVDESSVSGVIDNDHLNAAADDMNETVIEVNLPDYTTTS